LCIIYNVRGRYRVQLTDCALQDVPSSVFPVSVTPLRCFCVCVTASIILNASHILDCSFVSHFVPLQYDALIVLSLSPVFSLQQLQPKCRPPNVYSSRGATFLTYVAPTDRLTTDLTFGKIQMAISPQGVIRSTSCLVLLWGF